MFTEAYLEPCGTSTMEFFTKIVNGLYPSTIFAKMLPRRCLTGFLIRIWFTRCTMQNCFSKHFSWADTGFQQKLVKISK